MVQYPFPEARSRVNQNVGERLAFDLDGSIRNYELDFGDATVNYARRYFIERRVMI